MKKFLKTVAVFAALVLVLSCFAGCKNNSKGEDGNKVDGPWVEVTNLNDLIGTWVGTMQTSEEENTSETFAKKTYYGKQISESEITFNWKIDSNHILTYTIKTDSCATTTFIFSEPITNAEIPVIKEEWKKENEEYIKEMSSEGLSVTINVTNEKYVEKVTYSKDYSVSYSLKIEDGKCHAYDEDDDKGEYIKINKAKNGIQIFEDAIDAEPLFTMKKQ